MRRPPPSAGVKVTAKIPLPAQLRCRKTTSPFAKTSHLSSMSRDAYPRWIRSQSSSDQIRWGSRGIGRGSDIGSIRPENVDRVTRSSADIWPPYRGAENLFPSDRRVCGWNRRVPAARTHTVCGRPPGPASRPPDGGVRNARRDGRPAGHGRHRCPSFRAAPAGAARGPASAAHPLGQVRQVGVLGLGRPQDGGDRVQHQHLGRDVAAVALPQARAVRHRHPGRLRRPP